MTSWEIEFNVTASQVKQEIARIKKEKREYDDWGKPVDKLKRKKLLV